MSVGDQFRFSEVHADENIHSHNEVHISLNTSVNGFEKSSDDTVFALDIEFIIRFELDKNHLIEKEDAMENEWFFLNFAGIASKTIIDSILSHTALKGTFIPAHRLEDEE